MKHTMNFEQYNLLVAKGNEQIKNDKVGRDFTPVKLSEEYLLHGAGKRRPVWVEGSKSK